MKPYDKIADTECPSCGQTVLYKGKQKWVRENEYEILWGCCQCEIEGGFVVGKNFKLRKEKDKK